MNAVQSSRPRRPSLSYRDEDDVPSSSDVNLYHEIPDFELSLDEFEEFALARLKVLRKIEELKVRNITGDRFRSALDATLKAILPPSKSSSNGRMDVASHFILRAAYCRTEDLRRWFLSQECALFKHRLEKVIAQGGAKAFLQKNSRIQIGDRLSNADKDRLRSKLLALPGTTPGEFASTPYYAIPFTEALDLIAHRACYVEAGMAYVPLSKVMTIVTAKFRTHLSRSLVLASAAFSHVTSESDRIAPLLKNMNSQCTEKDRYTDGSGADCELTAANLDSFASNNMPLCMSQLHVGLKRDHKLKHWGRLQYGLFLKGAGLSMEESLLFFQREFTKIMTSEQFQKNYSYNIRHMYGKEGKRASYSPYNCTKIILGQPPQSGDHHGCPYKNYDETHLSALLDKLQIGTAVDRNAILGLNRSKNHQLACARHFEVMHPNVALRKDVNVEGVGNHPNAWFAASVSYHGPNKEGTDGSTKTEAAGTMPSPTEMET